MWWSPLILSEKPKRLIRPHNSVNSIPASDLPLSIFSRSFSNLDNGEPFPVTEFDELPYYTPSH